MRDFDGPAKHNTVAPFVDLLRKAFERFLSSLTPLPRASNPLVQLAPRTGDYSSGRIVSVSLSN
jgi:hypothetical protein